MKKRSICVVLRTKFRPRVRNTRNVLEFEFFAKKEKRFCIENEGHMYLALQFVYIFKGKSKLKLISTFKF